MDSNCPAFSHGEHFKVTPAFQFACLDDASSLVFGGFLCARLTFLPQTWKWPFSEEPWWLRDHSLGNCRNFQLDFWQLFAHFWIHHRSLCQTHLPETQQVRVLPPVPEIPASELSVPAGHKLITSAWKPRHLGPCSHLSPHSYTSVGMQPGVCWILGPARKPACMPSMHGARICPFSPVVSHPSTVTQR